MYVVATYKKDSTVVWEFDAQRCEPLHNRLLITSISDVTSSLYYRDWHITISHDKSRFKAKNGWELV